MLTISATAVHTQLAKEPGFPLSMATQTLESEDCYLKIQGVKEGCLTQGELISQLQYESRAWFHFSVVSRSLFLICPLINMG